MSGLSKRMIAYAQLGCYGVGEGICPDEFDDTTDWCGPCSTDRNIQDVQTLEALVDRLARALAADRMTVHTWEHKSRCWAMCESCRATLAEQNELGADTEAKAKRALEHRPDCVYIEAVEHVAALEHQ